jgi:hypothetical protein
MFSGALSAFCNTIYIFNIDSFSTMGWYDGYGNYRTLKFDTSSLFILAMIKIIVGGALIYKQGKISKDVLSPILKEYRLAETGQTTGIPMTVRKAPKMRHLIQIVKKITYATIIVWAFSMIVLKNLASDIVH